MQIKGLKVGLIAIVCTIVLGLLVGGTYLYNKLIIEKPLFKLYDNITEVKNFKIQKKGQNFEIIIELKETNNFQQTYRQLEEGTTKILADKPFNIVIKDKRSKELEEVFGDSQLLIYESLVRGNFSEMAQKIKDSTLEKNVEAKVGIDRENIFIQMKKEDKYLYEIIRWDNQKFGLNKIGSDENVEGI